MSEQYLEDFASGQVYRSGRMRVDAQRVKAFASEFDPQPFHLDDDAARRSIFGGLAASGWHTAALTMRLLVESDFKPAGGIVGVGFDELRWPLPVRPGDELYVAELVRDVGLILSRTVTHTDMKGKFNMKTNTTIQERDHEQVGREKDTECRYARLSPGTTPRVALFLCETRKSMGCPSLA